jgi:predicted unusual protein kinase regulating ubiquinone biosynthesis (AarF/ABC1/UbiB family)
MAPPQQPRKPVRRARMPTGRLERLARLGWLAGEVTVGAMAEGARRWFGGAASSAQSVFLTRSNAERLAKHLSDLRGAAMKVGQLLSLEGDDVAPGDFIAALAVLRAEGHAMPDAQLRRVLGRAWGRGWEQRFRYFGMEPIAAASIGQVHRAIATDGRELAVKVQYPGVARTIDSDVDNLASVLRLARMLPGGVDVSAILAESKRQLHQEANYRAEAEHLHRYRKLLADDPTFVVPAVYDDLTTTTVLAMDHLTGIRLDEVGGFPQPVRNRIGVALYRLLFRELFEFRFVQTDANFANFFLLPDSEQVALLDLGAARDVPEVLSRQYAEMFAATIQKDRRRLAEAMEEIGFVTPNDGREYVDGFMDVLLLACEPFRHRGTYDFGNSTISARAREAGMELTMRHGFRRPPPPDTVFLHRKLAGIFLLCVRLGARVDVSAALRPYVDGAR